MIAAVGAALLFAGAALAEEKALGWKSLEMAKVSQQGASARRSKMASRSRASSRWTRERCNFPSTPRAKGKFWEVIVDHATGKFSTTEEIKEGEDLSDARREKRF